MKVIMILVAICIAVAFLLGLGNKSAPTPIDSHDNYSTVDDISNDQVTGDTWDCIDDCSGHEAGYEWASDHEITDPYDCGGNSESFIEGCQSYANEQVAEEEYDKDYDEDYDYGY